MPGTKNEATEASLKISPNPSGKHCTLQVIVRMKWKSIIKTIFYVKNVYEWTQ